MNKQHGSTLVISLIFLTIITIVAVYSLEGSNLQTKMVANSLFSAITYQECRNEQEANVGFYNQNSGVNRSVLLDSINTSAPLKSDIGLTEDPARISSDYLPKSSISISWAYVRNAPSFRGGYDIDTESQSKAHLFDHGCDATFRSSSNSQTLGAIVDGLEQAGNIK